MTISTGIVATGGNIRGGINAQEAARHQWCMGTPLVCVAAEQVNCCFFFASPSFSPAYLLLATIGDSISDVIYGIVHWETRRWW